MANYFEFVVVPVQRKQLAAYKKMEKRWAKIWKSLGATDYVSTIAEDVKPGKLTSFPQALMLKKGEIAAVGCITYKSRRQRDALWKKMMAHPEMANMDMSKMPFDGKRMFWGGFKQVA
jgi:uncharacterized protein YbaA (DUF1428 family)